jgi:hypothetical protein
MSRPEQKMKLSAREDGAQDEKHPPSGWKWNTGNCVLLGILGWASVVGLCSFIGPKNNDFLFERLACPLFVAWIVGGPLALSFGVKGWRDTRSHPGNGERIAVVCGLVIGGLLAIAPILVMAYALIHGPFIP